jgi:nitrogen PTS system EIIA component
MAATRLALFDIIHSIMYFIHLFPVLKHTGKDKRPRHSRMMLDVKDVAKFLSLPEKTIYKWIKRNELPVIKIGERYRFNRVEILEWATAKKLAISPDLFIDRTSDETPSISLSEAIAEGGIHYNIAGIDRESVLRSIVEIIPLPPGTNKKLLADALIAREHLGTTAIGDGIAIPHVRNPVVINIDKPVMALCFLQQGINFDALDRKPVDTVFTIFTPNVRAHLSLLSRLSFALHRSDVRSRIDSGSDTGAILAAIAAFEATLEQPTPEEPSR